MHDLILGGVETGDGEGAGEYADAVADGDVGVEREAAGWEQGGEGGVLVVKGLVVEEGGFLGRRVGVIV